MGKHQLTRNLQKLAADTATSPVRTAIKEFRGRSWDEDDVIGRKFVPMGRLFRSWNLIVRACTDRNNQKSDLEDDLSAIKMQLVVSEDIRTRM